MNFTMERDFVSILTEFTSVLIFFTSTLPLEITSRTKWYRKSMCLVFSWNIQSFVKWTTLWLSQNTMIGSSREVISPRKCLEPNSLLNSLCDCHVIYFPARECIGGLKCWLPTNYTPSKGKNITRQKFPLI